MALEAGVQLDLPGSGDDGGAEDLRAGSVRMRKSSAGKTGKVAGCQAVAVDLRELSAPLLSLQCVPSE